MSDLSNEVKICPLKEMLERNHYDEKIDKMRACYSCDGKDNLCVDNPNNDYAASNGTTY